MSDRFELGVNYWPIRRAMSMWKELDLGEVREEMAHIADLGFDVVRFFALTEDFLPAPLVVPAARIADLVAVAAAARDAGLRSIPTLVVINMSGTFWWPAWLDPDRGGPDLYSDPLALRSQAALAGAVAAALAGDDSVRAFDLAKRDRRRLAPCHPPPRMAVVRAPRWRGAPRRPRRRGPVRRPHAVPGGREPHADRRSGAGG